MMIRTMLAVAAMTMLTAGQVHAEQIVYTPINPNFGGNPNNASGLMASATAQNNFKDPAAAAANAQLTPLQQFNQNLQQFVLNRVAASVTGNIINPTTGALTPGTIQTSNFTIQVIAVGTGVKVVTTDKTTGQSTFFQIN